MDTDAPPPATDPAVFARVRTALADAGPLAAVDALCDELRAAGDFPNLFYALLMRKRVELGVSPFPTGPASDLPPDTHAAYEDAIRDAARLVGTALIARGDIPKAWPFFRMIGEPEPVRQAIADYLPGPDDDPYPVIELAWQQALQPQKGFDLVLDRSGVCSAITMVSSSDLGQNPDLRAYCVRRLVRALHAQLSERLRADFAERGVPGAAAASIPELLQGQEALFADDLYHVDVSHLSSVAQMAMQLPKCAELDLARELCAYGAMLSPSLRGDNDPPFEQTYADYGKYLDVLAGVEVDAALGHFRDKLPTATENGYQFPAEVMVTLLVKADRPGEALAVARQHLAAADERSLSCPGVTELARQVGDYNAIASSAEARADPVGFLAGLIAGRAAG